MEVQLDLLYGLAQNPFEIIFTIFVLVFLIWLMEIIFKK